MMLLFKPEHVPLILDGTKTETRRLWKKRRAKVGAVHLAKTKMLSREYFARLKIESVHRENFWSIDEEGAQREGGYTVEQFVAKFFEINPKIGGLARCWKTPFSVWVVKFRVMEKDEK